VRVINTNVKDGLLAFSEWFVTIWNLYGSQKSLATLFSDVGYISCIRLVESSGLFIAIKEFCIIDCDLTKLWPCNCKVLQHPFDFDLRFQQTFMRISAH
jgi:hypothetical protein